MKEQLVTFETAKLAKEKGFELETQYTYDVDANYDLHLALRGTYGNYERNIYSAPTQSLLQKFIREERGVHIEIHRNASGYYWSMCKSDGGTDLGWCDHRGPNLGGAWDTFEDALENAMYVQLSYDLPNDMKVIKHWGNYVEFALKNE